MQPDQYFQADSIVPGMIVVSYQLSGTRLRNMA